MSELEPVQQNILIPITSLYEHKRNFRSHPPEQIKKLKASLERWGQVRSIVAQVNTDGTYTIVAGHGLVQAAQELVNAHASYYERFGKMRVDVIPASWSPEQVTGYLVADNTLSQDASDDEELLARLLLEQQDAGYDLASLGTDDETLRQMLEALGDEYAGGGSQGDEEDEFDEEVDEEQTRVQVGDVWQLGRHKIICGNSLDSTIYSKLLDSIRPHAIISDPPYGMRLDADFSGMVNKLQFAQEKGIKSGHKYANVIGDHEDFDASIILSIFSDVKEQFWFGADYYSVSLGDTMHTGCWLVWDKRLDESADKMYGSCFELIWSRQKHKRDMLRHKWAGVFGTEHEPQRGRQHPNQKPVPLLEDIITRYTDEGQIILDPFLGSGSTLISAERVGRTVYGCEISPAYCNVILNRFTSQAGMEPELVVRLEVANAS